MSDGVRVNNTAQLFPFVLFIMLHASIKSDSLSACTLYVGTVRRKRAVMKQATAKLRGGKMRLVLRTLSLVKQYLGCGIGITSQVL
jgi:hypothetical protein